MPHSPLITLSPTFLKRHGKSSKTTIANFLLGVPVSSLVTLTPTFLKRHGKSSKTAIANFLLGAGFATRYAVAHLPF